MGRERVVNISLKRSLVLALAVTIYGIIFSVSYHNNVGIILSLINLSLFTILYILVFRR